MFVADYGQLTIHRELLRDRVRVEAFREAIFATVRPGDVVLDMGAGTGILSVFAAQAGARKVYAVEPARIVAIAEQLVARNGVADRVEVIHSEMASARLPEQVDVIVSEWIGWYGIDENLLAPLVMARDRWLKPSGTMVPQQVTAWLAPAWDEELDADIRLWRSRPYEVDTSAIAQSMSHEVLVGRDNVSAQHLLAESQRMWVTDTRTCSAEEARGSFGASLSFRAVREGPFSGLAAWFTAELSSGVVLTNAPEAADTSWGRAVFPLSRTLAIEEGTDIHAQLSCEPAGPGYSHVKWSVRVGGHSWEHHDTRLEATLGAPRAEG